MKRFKRTLGLILAITVLLSNFAILLPAAAVDVSPTSISLSKSNLAIGVGGQELLAATVYPTNATNKTVIWSSSNPSVAIVSNFGLVSAIGYGTTLITARTINGLTASCIVTVSSTSSVTGVTLNKTTLDLLLGGSETLIATVSPANATDKSVRWFTSAPDIVTVNQSGRVTAVGFGTATIAVATTDGSFSATCVVTVTGTPVAVTGVSLNKTELTLCRQSYDTLTATILPSNAYNKNVTWSSDNTAVATVSNGRVNALTVGTANITVTTVDGGFTATCAVTVTDVPIPVTGITLNKTTLGIDAGDHETLNANILPSNATNKSIIWTSSNNSIAMVDSTGKVTGINAGTVLITAKSVDGNFTASCTVTVASSVRVQAVLLNKSVLELGMNDTFQLIATVYPQNADNKSLIWTSSNTSVVWVSDTGVVTPINVGTAIVTVRTVDGNFTALCTITVNNSTTGGTVDNAGNILISTSLVSADGKSELTISNDAVMASIAKNPREININITTPVATEEINVNIPIMYVILASSTNVSSININTNIGKISLPPDALRNKATSTNSIIKFNIHKLRANEIPYSVSSAGLNTVYDLNVYTDNTKITSFNLDVKVTLPYVLRAGESAESVLMHYVNNYSQLLPIPKSLYERNTSTISFYTNRFSMFTAKYVSVGFNDMSNFTWAAEPIYALYARGFINGVGNNKFAPERNITRAEFIKMLINTLGLTDDTATAGFSDVPYSHWAFRYIATAKKLGIVTGVSDTFFGASEYINRQEMAVLIYRTLNLLKINLPQDNTKPAFKDIYSASAYAVEAINTIYRAGIISGTGDGNFYPKNYATRAEVAKMIYTTFTLSLN